MTKALYRVIAEKSLSASLSAIEIYNKPDFKYREEIFTILIINAWELLLKAKIIKDKGEKRIYKKEYKKLKNGDKSKKKYYVPNRSGGKFTIGLNKTIKFCQDQKILNDKKVIENINALVEFRDSSVHFINKGNLKERLLDLSIGTLLNYKKIFDTWFNKEIKTTKFNFYICPITFNIPKEVKHGGRCSNVNKFMKYLDNLKKQYTSLPDSDYHFAIKYNVTLSNDLSGTPMRIAKFGEEADYVVELKEEEMSKKYPYTYYQLRDRIKNVLGDKFHQSTFNKVKKGLEPKNKEKNKYCYYRYLNKEAKKSLKKLWSNQAFERIVKELKKISF